VAAWFLSSCIIRGDIRLGYSICPFQFPRLVSQHLGMSSS
jgi:hypothetical protein